MRDAAGRERTLQVFAVRADGAAQPEPVAGRYAEAGDAIRFTPLYPFDPGRSYEVRYRSDAAGSCQPGRSG